MRTCAPRRDGTHIQTYTRTHTRIPGSSVAKETENACEGARER